MKIVHLFFIFFFFISCNSSNDNHAKLTDDSAVAIKTNDSILTGDSESENDGDYLENLTCDDLDNRKVIYDLASQEIDASSGITFDTSDVLVLRNHFISKDTLTTLILVQEQSLAYLLDKPCLLLLYNCRNVVRQVMNETTFGFSAKDIRDLDDDGVVEIISKSDYAGMGECSNTYRIFNFKNGKENVLYESGGYSHIDCLGDNDTRFKNGDTLGLEIADELIPTQNPKVFEVKEIHKYKICNGGKTAEEIVKKEIVTGDSVFIPLKSVK